MSKNCVVPHPPRPAKGLTFKEPPIDGSLTVPGIYDWHYDHNPDHPVFRFKPRHADGLVHLTYKDVVPAIHRAGARVSALVRTDLKDISAAAAGSVAILANTDMITYFCTVAGMLRANVPVVPIALINSPAAVAHLLQETGAVSVLASDDDATQALANRAISLIMNENPSKRVNINSIPTYEEIFEETEFIPLPDVEYSYTDPVLYVHSSGSTSLPKPIPWTHPSLLQIAASPCFGFWDLRHEIVGIQALSMAHAAGINQIPFVCSTGYTAATFPPGSPYHKHTPDSIMQSLRDTSPAFFFCVPMYLEIWSKSERDLEFLRSLTSIAYGGGPLPKRLGDFLVEKGLPLGTIYASTEGSVIGKFWPSIEHEDWQYFQISDHVSVRFVDMNDGTFEIVVVEAPTHHLPVVNSQFKGQAAYATKDLLVKHPTKPGYWSVAGRIDDQITLSNGLKTNPGPIERALREHPSVRAALAFGREHTHVGVLVFPNDGDIDPEDKDAVKRMRDLLWPTMQEINKTVPRHSQIMKDMILFASSRKPPILTEKGTTRKGDTLIQYQNEIAAAYTIQEAAIPDIPPPKTWTSDSTLEFVRAVVRCVVPSVLDDEQDLFDSGCTSFHALWISNAIFHALALPTDAVRNGFLYHHPTIRSLATFTLRLARGNMDDPAEPATREGTMRQFVKRFSPGTMPAQVSPTTTTTATGLIATTSTGRNQIAIVTGTTGALGSLVLAKLEACADVARVYAFNRKAPGETVLARQERAFKTRAVDISVASSDKISLLEVDLRRPDFGLPEALYQEMRSCVTHIYHIGWPVDFNRSLEGFADALAGVRTLINFTQSSPLDPPPRLLFTSTCGIFRGTPSATSDVTPRPPVPELPLEDPRAVAELGYTESKWVAEQLVHGAGAGGVVLRVGQLCGGGDNGAWETREWLPVLLRTSVALGCVPVLHGNVSWLPLDVAADAIIEARDTSHEFLHVVHPKPVQLHALMELLAGELGLPQCTYATWISKLEDEAQGRRLDADTIHRLPALKALDFFRVLRDTADSFEVPVECTNAMRAAPSLCAVPPLDGADVRRWVGYWRGTGFL